MIDGIDTARAQLAAIALGLFAPLAIACSGEATGDGMTPEVLETKRQEQALMSAGCRSTVCIRAGLAGCWTDPKLESSCRSCENTYGQANAMSIWSGCTKELAAHNACLKTATFVCETNGAARPTGCDETAAVVTTCMKGGASSDAGITDARSSD
jgi:hypothetical protein